MMRILLVAPYKNSYSGLAKFPPIGLGYLATSLRRRGHEVSILDCLNRNIDKCGYRDYLVRNKPDIVGVNSWSLSIKETEEILSITKDIDSAIVTIIGGPHPSALPVEAMEFFSFADFGFKGEAEVGLPLLFDKIENKKIDFGEIPGLIWKENGRWNVNEQVFHQDLEAFDYLAWDLVGPHDYSHPGTITYGRVAPIITTRGCPYLCTFCSPHTIVGRSVRRRLTGNILNEIKMLRDDYEIKGIAIMDENFTFYKDHVVSLCKAIIEEKLDMEFLLPNGIRLDTLDEEMLLLMREAGFDSHIAVGIESGSERILKAIRKNLDKETVREKIGLMRRCGFRPIGYFILGFPDETVNEMYETLKFARELRLHRAAFAPLLILPGTDIYERLKDLGELPTDYNFTALKTDNISRAPLGLTPKEFYIIRRDIILKFNLQPKVLLDYIRDLNSFVFATVKFKEIFLKRQTLLHG